MERRLADLITCAKFQDEIFEGLRFYSGWNFPFFLVILHGPYNSSATALPVMLFNKATEETAEPILTHNTSNRASPREVRMFWGSKQQFHNFRGSKSHKTTQNWPE